MITAKQITDLSMAIMDEILDNGTISTSDTKSYYARSPMILTLWQNEIATDLMVDIPAPITNLTQEITVGDTISGAYYLASILLLTEDPDSASFFNRKYIENKRLYMSRRPVEIATITDVYNIGGYDE